MIQRVKNKLEITITGADLNSATNIEAFFKQKSTGAEFKVSGAGITVGENSTISVTIDKNDAMKLDSGNCIGQVALTINNEPKITNVFNIPVEELIWSEGYGD